MIVNAALLFYNDECTITVYERHPDIYDRVIENPEFHILDYQVIEGFIDTENHFYNREEAFSEAIICHQINPNDLKTFRLYSEDLW